MLSMYAVLAAWFRLKYPHVAIGALASSSPILGFENLTSPYSFNNIITQDFKVSLSLSLDLFLSLTLVFYMLHSCPISYALELKDIKDEV